LYHFQIINRINDNAYELDLPNKYLGSNSFNVSDLTTFSTGVSNSWTNYLQPGEHDGTLRDKTTTELAQPSRRLTRSITQNPRLGQDQSTVSASESIIPQRIIKSKAHMIGDEHH